MITLSGSNPTIYAGFQDERLPDAGGLAEGAMFIVLQSAPPQIWIVRSATWTLLMPANLTVSIPLTPITTSALLAGPSGTTLQRQVVALGGAVNSTDISTLEQMSIRMEDSLNAILVELRLLNLQIQGQSTFPILDDLDSLRPALLNLDETITR